MASSRRYLRRLKEKMPGWVRRPVGWSIRQYRQMTSPFRVLPSFLIIGAPRCGTTSLYRYLTEHPQVAPAAYKETWYFLNFMDKGESWYRSKFATRAELKRIEARQGSPVLTGEASAAYLSHPYVPDRVKALLPDVKLLVTLRDPVVASYSLYYHGVELGDYTAESFPFAQHALEELEYYTTDEGVRLLRSGDPESSLKRRAQLLARYIYVDQLKHWYDVFPSSAIKVIIFEEFLKNPKEHMTDVFRFLGLPPHEQQSFKQYNACEYPPMDEGLRQRLKTFFAPHNRRLSEFLRVDLCWDKDCADSVPRDHHLSEYGACGSSAKE